MSDPDARPRPQYGEYATPEEQRARIRVPDATDALSSGEAPAPAASAEPAPERPRGLADRVLTIGLLGFGLWNVVTGIPRFLDYPAFADQFLAASGVTAAFTNVEQGRQWGLIGAVLFGVLWFVTAVLSALRLRRGRLAFWIPLTGAVVASVVVGVCLAVPIVNDAAVMQALLDMSGATPSPTPTL